jgi:hypothetical protein
MENCACHHWRLGGNLELTGKVEPAREMRDKNAGEQNLQKLQKIVRQMILIPLVLHTHTHTHREMKNTVM